MNTDNPIIRTVWFFLRTALIIAALILIMRFAYYTAKQSAHVYVITFEGMNDRAESIINASKENTSYDLNEFFTEQEITGDELINKDPYRNYDVTSYDYSIHIEAVYALPWDKIATVRVREIVSKIDGKILDPALAADSSLPVVPPQWAPHRYNVKLIKSGKNWLISEIEKIGDVDINSPKLTASSSPLPSPSP